MNTHPRHLLPTQLSALLLLAPLASEAADAVEHITLLAQPRSGLPVIVKGEESIRTKATFRPPVEITVEAKTDSTDLRLAYAANQIIFNWRDLPNQLRVDGGPSVQHKTGAGAIPAQTRGRSTPRSAGEF